MKSNLIATALFLGMLSASAFAHSSTGHHAAPSNKHEDHDSAIGSPGKAAEVTRTLEVGMNDTMRFTPASLSVKRGETIRFLVKNNGKVKHEMVMGSTKELKEHASMMRKMPEMEHADENQVSVDPGKTGEIIWHFTKSGKFDFACLQPGHFEAGMKGKIAVK